MGCAFCRCVVRTVTEVHQHSNATPESIAGPSTKSMVVYHRGFAVVVGTYPRQPGNKYMAVWK